MNIANCVNVRGVYFANNIWPTEPAVDIRTSTNKGRLVIPRTVNGPVLKICETYQVIKDRIKFPVL